MALHTLESDPEYINLQTELIWLQQQIKLQRKRMVIVFEGRDTAGKGGAIMRFVRFLNPRNYRVVALSKPTDIEIEQWYFQRYIKEFPRPGEIVFFDRSWYNRAVVEPVMGFCTESQYKLFMKQVVQLEHMWAEDGLILIKFWFSIDIQEQQKRLEERKVNPLKQWKLSTIDIQAQQKWSEFTFFKEEMFKLTGTKENPWVIIKGNERETARKEAMRYVLSRMNYDQKGETGENLAIDPVIITLEESAGSAENKRL